MARNRAIENKEQLEQMRAELKSVVKAFFQHIQTRKVPTLTPEQLEKISYYAEFVARIRTVVTSQAFREYDTSEWQPEPEFATRLARQFRKLAECVALVRGHFEVTVEDMAAVGRVAADTCLPNRPQIIQALYYAQEPLSIADVGRKSGLSYWKARNSLEALTVIRGIVEEIGSEKQHNEGFYQLATPFRQLLGKVLKP